MEKDPRPAERSSSTGDDSTLPPFQPDPEIVSVLELGSRDDPKADSAR
jgi:hypothetical protein